MSTTLVPLPPWPASPADRQRQLAELRAMFPRAACWYGDRSGLWPAAPVGAARLVEASTAAACRPGRVRHVAAGDEPSGADRGGGMSGHVRLTRELWGAVLAGLDSGHPAVRDRVYAAVLAIAPQEWDEDLRTPGMPARRLADIGVPGPRPTAAASSVPREETADGRDLAGLVRRPGEDGDRRER